MWTQSSTNALTTRPTRTPARVMDSGTCTHAAPSHEDTSTDWDDIQARLGNAKPKPKPPKPGKLEVAFDVENRDADARQAADDDVDFEADDDDDDEYVREYRARRLAEMHAASNAITYGEVIDTTRERFVADVTEPSSSGYVVVCMTRKGYASMARWRTCYPRPSDRPTDTRVFFSSTGVPIATKWNERLTRSRASTAGRNSSASRIATAFLIIQIDSRRRCSCTRTRTSRARLRL